MQGGVDHLPGGKGRGEKKPSAAFVNGTIGSVSWATGANGGGGRTKETGGGAGGQRWWLEEKSCHSMPRDDLGKKL